VRPVPSFTGVRSPPLRGVDDPRRDGLAEEGLEMTQGAISRRDALCASAWQGCTDAEAFRFHRMRAREAGTLTGRSPLGANAFLYGRAEPAPPGGEPRARWPSGERPGDRAMGGFLGGTRSARPRGKAGRKPGYGMITEK